MGERGNEMRSAHAGRRGRRSGRRAIALLAAAVALCAWAPSAFAAKSHLLVKATSKPLVGAEVFGHLAGIGVDEDNGNVFVGNSREGIYFIDAFGPDGEEPDGVVSPYSITVGPGTGGRAGIAVDNSPTSSARGDLYAVDPEEGLVKHYALNPGSEQYELQGSFGEGDPTDVAVDPSGKVLVADGSSGAIALFDSAGTQLGSIEVGFPVSGIALDSSGNLFVVEALSSTAAGKVVELAANGSGEIEPGTLPETIVSGSPGDQASRPVAIAVDRASDELFIAFSNRVEQYDSTDERIGEFADDHLELMQYVAVNPLMGGVYVLGPYSETIPIGGTRPTLAIFGPTVLTPDATVEAASDLTPSSATLNGTVSAAGGLDATCKFQYVDGEGFAESGFADAATAPCEPAGPFTGSTPQPVTAAVGDLETRTTYHVRLLASSANGTTRSDELTFFTPGSPIVSSAFAADVTSTSATLTASINPAGLATGYAFEYVSEADFLADGYAQAVTVPAGGGSAGGGKAPIPVSAPISGLVPGGSYLFRVTATNGLGSDTRADLFFTTITLGGPALPDGRVYEQATPVDKQGTNPRGETGLLRAATNGNGITFYATGGIPGGEGSQAFPIYLSTRSASGWSSQGVLPPASSGSSAATRGFSEDLSQVYVTQAEQPAEPGAFYQRDMATHALRPIMDVPNINSPFNRFISETADGSEVLVELDATAIPPGAGANTHNAYIWSKSTGALTAVGVLNNGRSPTGGTSAGSYEIAGFPTTFARAENPIAADGSRVFFTGIGNHQLYVRSNPTQPQSPVSGGVCTIASAACTAQVSLAEAGVSDPNGAQPATFWFATPDGSAAFFTSPGRLTADADTGPNDEGSDLYRYDVESRDLTDLSVGADPGEPKGADVQGVVGVSDDGAYVYFVANGVLTEEPNAEGQVAKAGDCTANGEFIELAEGSCNLYLWHEGEVSFIAPQRAVAQRPATDALNWSRHPASVNTGSFSQRSARVTPDGKTLLFRSREQVTDYDNAGLNEFYLYDADEADLNCISCNPGGAPPVASASLQEATVFPGNSPQSAGILTRNLSPDGDRVFFESPDKLVAADTNGDHGCPMFGTGAVNVPSCLDVYEWEASGTGSCQSSFQNGGCLHLISSGKSDEPSLFADASRSGDDVFFFTGESLVGQDRDELVDIYDARVGGGLAAQNPATAPICEGEACKPSPIPAPPSQSPGSASFQGPGNQKTVQHQKKKRKKKARKKKHGKRGASKGRHGRAAR